MLILMKCVLAGFLAAGSGLLGCRWMDDLYQKSTAILSFPDKVAAQQVRRPREFIPTLFLLFAFTLITMHHLHPVRLAFLLVFQYFLLLYTWTDIEQHVIFDRMMIPFAVLGAISLPVLDRVVTDHLEAAAVGGIVFLLLAIVTHGGIGGGDIKLIAVLGLWLGTDMLLTIVISGVVLAGIAAIIMLVTKKKGRQDYFAYGPYFTLSALAFTLL